GNGFIAASDAAWQAGDNATLRRLAHSLKSSARTLGAKVLGDLAARLEEAVANETSAQEDCLAEVRLELDKVLGGLDRLPVFEVDSPSRDATLGKMSPSDRHAVIQGLLRLLEEQDTAAREWVARLDGAVAGSGHEPEAAEIARAVARYDFSHALARLQQLASALGMPERLEGLEKTT
ncbi:MAG TPA: Hpt domain-containing protein, partial [Rhodocyclaceae bacterium]|nr:Hpt domain-containing protein [Rhodocyclaceae bacterium]